MAAIDLAGYLLVALGPGAAFFLVFIAPKSFVVLLSLFSAFLWLCVLLFISAVLRGFVPLRQTAAAYAGVVLAAVAIEEAARYGVWQLHLRMCRALEAMARRRGHAFSYADRVHLALGWGAGHAATHALFLCAALLPLAAGDGSLYAAACPAMSVFTAAALQCLGTSATLVAASVVGLEGWRRRSALHAAYAPAVHAASALMTLGSFAQGGCAASVPAVVAFGALNAAYAARYVWRHAPPPQPQVPLSPIGGAASRRPRREVHTAVVPAAAAAAAAAAGPPPVMAATGAAAVGGGGGGD